MTDINGQQHAVGTFVLMETRNVIQQVRRTETALADKEINQFLIHL